MIMLLRWLLPAFAHVAAGPIVETIEHMVGDKDLRERLKAEVRGKIIEHQTALIDRQSQVILAESRSESWITRNWRPILMVLLMSFLVLFGFALPIAEVLTGHHLMFKPRFDLLPGPAWDLLTIGLGGYIGGRSAEKIAASLASARGVNVNSPVVKAQNGNARRK